MPNEPESLTIGAFAEQAAITVETIRFYQRRGLLPTPKKPQGGIRRYNRQHVARARFIRSAQGLGFSLHEIASLLRLDDGLHCAQARTVAEAKLADVRGKIADLTRIETVLADLVTDCLGARGRIACPLIDAIHSR